MWNNLKPAKRMLEALWSAGDLVVAGRQGFQRLYDLPERVLPASVLGAPVPDADEVLRELVVRAVRARGALTDAGVVEHWRLKGGTARIRPHTDALVSSGILRRLEVADGGAAVLVASDELDDLRTCDRVLAMFGGRVVAEFAADWGDSELIAAMEGIGE
jgi:uncharacterized protein YcaQ